jgi:hypothetical protein
MKPRIAAASATILWRTTGRAFRASSVGWVGSMPIAALIVSGNLAGFAVARTTLGREPSRSLKAQAVCGSTM